MPLAQVLARSRGVLIGFNGGVCDLAKHIPESVPRQIFDYMFERGERFSIVQMLSDLGPMVDLALERGYGDMALDLLSEAEWHASRKAARVNIDEPAIDQDPQPGRAGIGFCHATPAGEWLGRDPPLFNGRAMAADRTRPRRSRTQPARQRLM